MLTEINYNNLVNGNNFDDLIADKNICKKKLFIEPYYFSIEVDNTTNEKMLDIRDDILKRFNTSIKEVISDVPSAKVELSLVPAYVGLHADGLDAKTTLEDIELKTYEVQVDWDSQYFSVNAYNEDDARRVIQDEISRLANFDDWDADVEESDKDLTEEGRGIFQ